MPDTHQYSTLILAQVEFPRRGRWDAVRWPWTTDRRCRPLRVPWKDTRLLRWTHPALRAIVRRAAPLIGVVSWRSLRTSRNSLGHPVGECVWCQERLTHHSCRIRQTIPVTIHRTWPSLGHHPHNHPARMWVCPRSIPSPRRCNGNDTEEGERTCEGNHQKDINLVSGRVEASKQKPKMQETHKSRRRAFSLLYLWITNPINSSLRLIKSSPQHTAPQTSTPSSDI